MQNIQIIRRDASYHNEWPANIPPVLQRIYSHRGTKTLEQAQPQLKHLLAPDLLSPDPHTGMPAALALLTDAIIQQQHIVVVGDFDCDGATACAVGVRGLKLLGANNVSYAVPNRMVHGYGLSPAWVEELAGLKPDVLVTVDHGIVCYAGVELAKQKGWKVIVTDHHLPGESLPSADAVINPNLKNDPFPSKAMAGVGVMFYVLMALRRHLHTIGQITTLPDLRSLLDLVAAGTVADLVALDTNNRALVGAGLRRLRASQCCVGLQALMAVAKCNPNTLTASDIGFRLAPRINAAGRLEDMALGIELLTTDNKHHAEKIAETLNEINVERRAIQQTITDEAELAVNKAHALLKEQIPIAICLFDPEWHAGVVGLVASKIKDKCHRPVFVFAPSEPESTSLRGSGRSISGFHIRDAIAAIDAEYPHLISKFGGHAMAAGMSISQENLPVFEKAFIQYAERQLDPHLLQAQLESDGELSFNEINYHHALALRDGGPWGQGFPEPLFDGEFIVLDWKVMQERHLKLTLRHPDHDMPLNAVYFNSWKNQPPPSKIHLAYRLMPDSFRGGEAIQLLVEYYSSLE